MKRYVDKLKNNRKKKCIYIHKSNKHWKNTYKIRNNIMSIKMKKMKRYADELKIIKNIYTHKVTNTEKMHIK